MVRVLPRRGRGCACRQQKKAPRKSQISSYELLLNVHDVRARETLSDVIISNFNLRWAKRLAGYFLTSQKIVARPCPYTMTALSRPRRKLAIAAALVTLNAASHCRAFTVQPQLSVTRHNPTRLFSDPWSDQSQDANTWGSSSDSEYQDQVDWQELLAKKDDGSYWSSFEPSSKEEDTLNNMTASVDTLSEDDAADAWLDTLAALSAEEVEFNMKEADRADKVRQMQEWGFEPETIANTLNVAVNDELEKDEVEGMTAYRQASYLEDDIDLTTVESHSRVEKDPDTGEPFRQQMVYVDEHTWYVVECCLNYIGVLKWLLCASPRLTHSTTKKNHKSIGCTNCAMIAQSTFFMHQEHGRARVFEQWGDDDETIQVAIETCPVDCIHYVPYDELVKLEVERRDQNINFKARLVSQAEYGGLGLSHAVGGPNAFTAPQKISGNMGVRCNNCPSRGCKTCPMFGVGKNPEFERKEKERLAKMEKKRIQERRERENKSADL